MTQSDRICHRTACNYPNAVWFHTQNHQWYCPKCAHKINDANGGKLLERRLDVLPRGVKPISDHERQVEISQNNNKETGDAKKLQYPQI